MWKKLFITHRLKISQLQSENYGEQKKFKQ